MAMPPLPIPREWKLTPLMVILWVLKDIFLDDDLMKIQSSHKNNDIKIRKLFAEMLATFPMERPFQWEFVAYCKTK